jgi:cbb3-type cytochrome oxidase subunit 3
MFLIIIIFYLFRRRNMAKRASSRGLPKGDNLEPGAKKKEME